MRVPLPMQRVERRSNECNLPGSEQVLREWRSAVTLPRSSGMRVLAAFLAGHNVGPRKVMIA
jgi:hypothetical protein